MLYEEDDFGFYRDNDDTFDEHDYKTSVFPSAPFEYEEDDPNEYPSFPTYFPPLVFEDEDVEEPYDYYEEEDYYDFGPEYNDGFFDPYEGGF